MRADGTPIPALIPVSAGGTVLRQLQTGRTRAPVAALGIHTAMGAAVLGLALVDVTTGTLIGGQTVARWAAALVRSIRVDAQVRTAVALSAFVNVTAAVVAVQTVTLRTEAGVATFGVLAISRTIVQLFSALVYILAGETIIVNPKTVRTTALKRSICVDTLVRAAAEVCQALVHVETHLPVYVKLASGSAGAGGATRHVGTDVTAASIGHPTFVEVLTCVTIGGQLVAVKTPTVVVARGVLTLVITLMQLFGALVDVFAGEAVRGETVPGPAAALCTTRRRR